MPNGKPILVTGASGAQGGAVIDALLEADIPVHALVRDPTSPAARALAARGATLIKGDFDDAASLAEAVRGAGGVFSVQMPPMPNDPESELRTGKRLIDAARQAGVEVFVHTSVARAGEQESFVGWSERRWWPGYWMSKAGVNAAVKAAGFVHWVILKPAFMMDNFIPPKAPFMFPSLARGALDTTIAPATHLDLIAASDVGRFAAAAFADPGRFDRQEIDLAADALTMDEVAAILSEVSGKSVTARSLAPEQAVAAGNHAGVVESQQWANIEGYKVDRARANSHGILLERFAHWAQRHSSEFVIGNP